MNNYNNLFFNYAFFVVRAMAQKTKTTHIKNFLNASVATNLFERLRDNTQWHEGIKSKQGHTRLAYRVDSFESLDDDIQELIKNCLNAFASNLPNPIGIAGTYFNYYRNGDDFTPNHSHPGTIQLIISLGATRTLNVGKKNIPMGNGDLAVFGASIHGVPKEPQVKEGRISIALFLVRP